jgi:hypothetical protein
MLKYSRLLVAMIVAAASGVTFGFVSNKADPHSRYQSAVQRIEAHFQAAQVKCERMPPANLRLCLAMALSEKWRMLADAQVRLHDTPNARRNQRLIVAGGELLVALQRCGVRTPGEPDACRDSAKNSFMREVAKAKATRMGDYSCSPGECAWLPGFSHSASITSL